MSYKRWSLVTLILFVSLFIAACGGIELKSATTFQALPDYVQNASHKVQAAYQFAADHPELLTHQPCYCSCGAMGHMHNLHCFIRAIDERGSITFDNHGAGCGICVDIALDVKRLWEEGKSQTEIRQYIDATYSYFGPSTDTPLPEA